MRKAIYALLHSSVHIKVIGELGTSLPSQSKTIDNLEMFYGPEGLVVSGVYKGLRLSFAVPTGNIKVVQLVPEDPKPAEDPKAPKAVKPKAE